MSRSKLQQISGPTTPKTFAGLLVEHADEIEHIAVVIQWKDKKKTTRAYGTQMTLRDMAWLKYVFNDQFGECYPFDPDGPDPDDLHDAPDDMTDQPDGAA